jgi:hypothetical protein
MTVIPDTWRTFCASRNVLAHRNQSRAFLNGEGLGYVALLPNSKHLDTQLKRSIDDWTNVDLLDFRNWGVPLMRNNLFAWGDIDVDARPPKGVGWTPEYRDQARRILRPLLDMLERFGVYSRTFGRESLGFCGHAIVQVALETKNDLEVLRSLNMLRPIPIGDLMVRIEFRIQADRGDPNKKSWTLPGSTYPSLIPEEGFELVGWNPLFDFTDLQHMPKLPQTPVEALRKALYAFLFLTVLRPHWIEGGRHQLSLEAAGALAHETRAGTFMDAETAKTIFTSALDALGERGKDREDRLAVFDDTMRAIGLDKPVTGYKTLGETIGEDARNALLRLRGGSDPDAIAEMFRRIVNVASGLSERPCFLDISRAGLPYQELTYEQLAQLYTTDPAFPPLVGFKGAKIPLIKYVLSSDKIQRVDKAIQLPGITFGSRYYRDHGHWRELDPESSGAAVQTAINVAEGMLTTTEPTPAMLARWTELWRRHLEPITDDDEKQVKRLEDAIAKKMQRPRDKLALGLCITAGQGTGKSALLELVLKQVIGHHLVAMTSGADLKERFRFQEVSTCLFYGVEEVNFAKADKSLRETIKNLNKNPSLPVDHKNGRKSSDPNVCVPIYLTNDSNPSLIIEGQADRSLMVIRGATQASKGMSLAVWSTYLKEIAAEVAEFKDALEDPALCNAGRWYFLHLPLTDDADMMVDNLETTSTGDRRSSLSPAHEAIFEMLESGLIRPGIATTPIMGPFALETVVLGIRERLKNRGASSFVATNQEVGMLFHQIFPQILKPMKVYVNTIGKQVRVYYLGKKVGELFTHILTHHGVELTPPHEFDDNDFGDAPEPDRAGAELAWRLSKDPTAGFGY